MTHTEAGGMTHPPSRGVIHTLARIRTPAPGFSEPSLYARYGEATVTGEGLCLPAGERATFDTAFGVFSAGRWSRLTNLADVGVRIETSGQALVELIAFSDGIETVVASSDDGADLWCDDMRAVAAESFYVAVTALGAPVTVRGGEWLTRTPPVREVRLGVSITTFNRQEYVLATIDRLVKLESDDDVVRGRVQVLVVDNAQNLRPDVPASAPVRVVPNPNLGGAGGFARGLIEFRDGEWATHVVFMDDDISLEPESIVRTLSLLSHAVSDDLCVHGAMISEEQPWMQFEAGSSYEFRSVYPLRAIGREVDLRRRGDVLHDHLEPEIDYSAWWYTVFPLHLAKDNPLPVFVRGDDVAFGLMHTGRHTVTLNGIFVWHADFALKNNPSSLYYEIRNFALIDTLVFDDHKWWHLAWRYLGFGFRNAYSHRYASAEYMIKGMRDFLAGPEAWMAIDHSAKHDEIRRVDEEKAAPLSDEMRELGFTAPRPKIVRLGGFLLSPLTGAGKWIPSFLRSKSIGVAQIDVRAVGLAIRHDTILYRHPRFDEGFICRRDYKRFVAIQREVFSTTWRLFRDYKSLKRAYREWYPRLVSDEAWKARCGVS